MFKKLYSILSLALCCSSYGGTFTVLDQDSNKITVEYTGTIEQQDISKWRDTYNNSDKQVVLIINSRGGSAKGAIDLYWELKKVSLLETVAGQDVGAWSGAALLWLAGSTRTLEEGALVMFHAPYCTWDENPFPDIGCNTAISQDKFRKVFLDAGYNGARFMDCLNSIQTGFGTDGWLGTLGNSNNWYLIDSNTLLILRFNMESLK